MMMITNQANQANQANQRMQEYLKSHFIYNVEDSVDVVPRLTMVYNNYNQSPDRKIESCIYFHSKAMEVKVYYSILGSEICRESEHKGELFRLLNFINARVFIRTEDRIGGKLYSPSYLYLPRISITEDGAYDIALNSLIPYDFYDLAPIETADYITADCPLVLDLLSPAIFGVLIGELSAEEGIALVKKNVLMEED